MNQGHLGPEPTQLTTLLPLQPSTTKLKPEESVIVMGKIESNTRLTHNITLLLGSLGMLNLSVAF